MGCCRSKAATAVVPETPLANVDHVDDSALKSDDDETGEKALITSRFRADYSHYLSEDILLSLLSAPKEIRFHFDEFTRHQQSFNNVAFLDAINDFEDRVTRGQAPESLEHCLDDILNQYIAPGGVDEVNISGKARAVLLKSKGRIFADARSEITQLLAVDCLPRFMRSHHSTALAAALRANPELSWTRKLRRVQSTLGSGQGSAVVAGSAGTVGVRTRSSSGSSGSSRSSEAGPREQHAMSPAPASGSLASLRSSHGSAGGSMRESASAGPGTLEYARSPLADAAVPSRKPSAAYSEFSSASSAAGAHGDADAGLSLHAGSSSASLRPTDPITHAPITIRTKQPFPESTDSTGSAPEPHPHGRSSSSIVVSDRGPHSHGDSAGGDPAGSTAKGGGAANDGVTPGGTRPQTAPAEVVVIAGDLLSALELAKQRISSSSWIELFTGVADLLDMCVVITSMRIPGSPIIYANSAFYKLTQFHKDEVIGRNCRFLQGPGTLPQDIERIRCAIRAARPLNLEITNYKRDGTPFKNYLSLKPIFERPTKQRRSTTGHANTVMTTATAADAATLASPSALAFTPHSPAPVTPKYLLPSGVSTPAAPYHHLPVSCEGGYNAELLYFVGVQFEVTEETVKADILGKHQALFAMLPSTVFT